MTVLPGAPGRSAGFGPRPLTVLVAGVRDIDGAELSGRLD